MRRDKRLTFCQSTTKLSTNINFEGALSYKPENVDNKGSITGNLYIDN